MRPDGGTEELPPMFSMEIEAGDVFAHRTAGGGGWGDPLERDPAAVAADVADEKVSPGAARQLYGVVADAAGRLDEQATMDLRAVRRSG